MALIGAYLRKAAGFFFNGLGATADPGTWTPPAITPTSTNSTFIMQSMGWSLTSNYANFALHAAPAGWVNRTGQGASMVATWVHQGSAPPTTAITWTTSTTPTQDVVELVILEYLEGLVPASTSPFPVNGFPSGTTSVTATGQASGQGAGTDELLIFFPTQNAASNVFGTISWTFTGSSFGVDYTGTLPFVVGRRAYSNAAGSGNVTGKGNGGDPANLTANVSTLVLPTCGAPGGLCLASGAFTLPAGNRGRLRHGGGGRGGGGKGGQPGSFTVDPFGGFAPGRWPPVY